MAGRVAVLSPEGQFGTVDEADVEAVTRAGGRVLTRQEVAQQQADEQYAKQPTWKKVATVATMAGPLGYIPHLALRADGAQLPPELESYAQGVSGGMTGGLASLGMKEAITAVGGEDAAKAYATQAQRASEGYAGTHMAGEIAGFVGGAVAGGPKAGLGKAANLIPGAAVNTVGNAVEKAVAERLASFAARGVAARAVATGAELGARGAVEGAIYSGAQAITEDMLGDREVAADKIASAMGMGFLGGAVGGGVLGGAGSLAASGVRGAVGSARTAVGRVLAKGEQTVAKGEQALATAGARAEAAAQEAKALAKEGLEDAATAAKRAGEQADDAVRAAIGKTQADAKASLKGIAEATGTKAEQEIASLNGAIERAKDPLTQKGWAYEQAWKAIGAGQGLQSTSFAKSAERYLPNGTKDVGETLLRKGVINVEEGWVAAAKAGTPESMLPKITAAKNAVGEEIGAITAASPATVDAMSIGKAVDNVVGKYADSAATRPVARQLRNYAMELFDSLGLDKRQSVGVQDLLRERKALDLLVFENASLDPALGVQVKRELRGELEGLIVKALDDASGDVPGALRDKYKALKKDYTALSIAEDAAADSAARRMKARSLSLTDYIAGGGSIVASVGHKLVRERGNAAAAVLIHRMADMGTLTKAIAAVDEQMGKAARGLLTPPARKPLAEPAPKEPVRVRAQRAIERVAQIQANPEALVDHVTRAVEPMSSTAPQLAGAVTQRMTDAAAFLASKIPVKQDTDPFDPHPAPRLSEAQAATFMRYVQYAERPMRFFEELERGKITYEGVETIRTLMPAQFAELQQRTLDGLADLMARGQRVPYQQRERLGILLDIPAVPSQRPDHMRLLQQNVLGSEQAAKATPPPTPGAPAPKRPLATKTQQSTLDRLEGR